MRCSSKNYCAMDEILKEKRFKNIAQLAISMYGEIKTRRVHKTNNPIFPKIIIGKCSTDNL